MHQHLPMVALESTVISHGLPYPENLGIAQAMEAIVREHGAEPCTVAILGGELLAGLTYAQLHHLATTPNVPKVSRRDLPIVVGHGGRMGPPRWPPPCGSPTASASRSSPPAAMSGVHRGDGTNVSADLAELAQTPVIVVCAGAKAILDLPATLEYLETHGVTVVGYRPMSSRPSTAGAAGCRWMCGAIRRARWWLSGTPSRSWGWRAGCW